MTRNDLVCQTFFSDPIELIINPLPVIVSNVSLFQCDQDTDGVTIFNLNEANALISSNHTNESFSYYHNYSDAEQGNTNAIASPIDYENLRSKVGARYLGFGRFAGIVGCYNTLNLFLSQNNFQPLARAYKINDYERIKNNLSEVRFPNFKLLVTGDGRVNNGVQELLKYTNIKQVSDEEFLKSNFEYPVYCNLETKDYVIHKNKKPFELKHFIEFPSEYESQTYEYLKVSDLFISAHYWDPSSPKIFTKEQMKEFLKLKIIGDITCDVDGSIPTTIKSTTIEEPNFFLNTEIFSETKKVDGNLAIMAVDNLPSELPRDSSTEFGNGIVNEVLPYILEEDDGRILNSTIAAEGRFLKKYNYLNEYINS